MAADPDSFFTAEKVIAAVVAVVTPIWGARTWLERRFAKKADKDVVTAEFQEVRDELAYQRGIQAKLFDQLRENEQRAQDRHERLMEKLAK